MSWFRTEDGSHVAHHGGGGRSSDLSMKDAVRVLHPTRASAYQSRMPWDRRPDDRTRFSSLLLEHGEKHIQDWAVIAYTQPLSSTMSPEEPVSQSTELAAKDPGATKALYSASTLRKSGKVEWVQSLTSTRSQKSRVGNSASVSTSTPASTAAPTTPRKFQQSYVRKARMNSKGAPPAAVDKDSYPSVHMTNIEGRLHLCSLSIVFEPTDQSRGLVRCPFAKLEAPPKEYPPEDPAATTGSFEPTCVEFTSHRHVIMKPNNQIGPFQRVSVSTIFRYTFLHSSPSPLVELCRELFFIWNPPSKPIKPQQEMLEDLLRPMLDRPFDPSNLVDVRERPLTSNMRCQLITPLQSTPGCLVVTHERVYFQPALGVLSLEDTPRAINWPISSTSSSGRGYHDAGGSQNLVATARRYRGLSDTALELFWKDGTSNLIALERTLEREQVLRLVSGSSSFSSLHQTVPCHTDRNFVIQATQAWQSGEISNYDYLLLLNSSAGRTVHDLSRYPVFPWVIRDFTSSKLDLNNRDSFRDLTKPMGALNPERLKYFRQRMASMEEIQQQSIGHTGSGDGSVGDTQDQNELAPFLYGTHYSAAGYVLYYLLRSLPEHMLCLQNGKFDAPDRMFHSISHCFNCVLTNHADVKELIPEFYNVHHDFDFLINARSLQLGATQTGDRVDDVALPPWAKSPRDFIKKNRKALESEICTAMLPRWIDLIFGNKSRGEPAKEADNLFHRMSYMGPSDLKAMATKEERTQAELQATEFGIVPDQLFVGPHPLRHETVDESFISPDIGRSFNGTDEALMNEAGGNLSKGEAWEILDSPSQSGSQTTPVVPKDKNGDSTKIVSVNSGESNDGSVDINHGNSDDGTESYAKPDPVVDESDVHPPSQQQNIPLVSAPTNDASNHSSIPLSGTGDGGNGRNEEDGFWTSVLQGLKR